MGPGGVRLQPGPKCQIQAEGPTHHLVLSVWAWPTRAASPSLRIHCAVQPDSP